MGSCSTKRTVFANCDTSGVKDQIVQEIDGNNINNLKALIEEYTKIPSNVYAVNMFEIDQEVTEI